MSQRRYGPDERDGRGHSSFAQRGQSTEERMRDDDSAQRFPGRSPGRSRQSEEQLSDPSRGGYPRDGYFGSGGSYGYGGSFEHGGPRGYQDRDDGYYQPGGEQFYESTGGFGRDTHAYGRHGLGYPGREEHRTGWSPGPAPRHYINEDSNRSVAHEDARRGYSQESGYMQSGGDRVGPQQGGQGGGYGSGYGSSRQHADRYGHEGGGTRASRPNNQEQRGPFYGRTPQGYTRSDDRIREDVCDRLSHGHFDPTEVSVKVSQGVVTLEGFVEERHEKFHAEEIAESVLGVKDVENNLRLKRGRVSGTQEQSRTSPLPNGEGNPPNGEGNPRNRA